MSNVPTALKYATSHEWECDVGYGEYLVGITEHAQELLGDMVFVDLPEIGTIVSAGDDCAVAESAKAASDIYAPISGEIIAVNDALEKCTGAGEQRTLRRRLAVPYQGVRRR